jgi:hypothetical protein
VRRAQQLLDDAAHPRAPEHAPEGQDLSGGVVDDAEPRAIALRHAEDPRVDPLLPRRARRRGLAVAGREELIEGDDRVEHTPAIEEPLDDDDPVACEPLPVDLRRLHDKPSRSGATKRRIGRSRSAAW